VDVWGCGMVLAEVCNLQPLFPGRNVLDQLGRIFATLGVPDADSWEGIECLPDYGKVKFVSKACDGDMLVEAVPRIGECKLLQELLTAMLTLDPTKRPQAICCLEHSWFFRRPLASGSSLIAKDLIPKELTVPEVMGFNDMDCVSGCKEDRENMKERYLNKLKRQGVCVATVQRKVRSGIFGDDAIGVVAVEGYTQDARSKHGLLHMLSSLVNPI